MIDEMVAQRGQEAGQGYSVSQCRIRHQNPGLCAFGVFPHCSDFMIRRICRSEVRSLVNSMFSQIWHYHQFATRTHLSNSVSSSWSQGVTAAQEQLCTEWPVTDADQEAEVQANGWWSSLQPHGLPSTLLTALPGTRTASIIHSVHQPRGVL